MTTEQKVKIRAIFIVIVRSVQKPVKNTKRGARNLLEMAKKLFPSFALSENKWNQLYQKMIQLLQNGDEQGAQLLLEQALLPESSKTAQPDAGGEADAAAGPETDEPEDGLH